MDVASEDNHWRVCGAVLESCRRRQVGFVVVVVVVGRATEENPKTDCGLGSTAMTLRAIYVDIAIFMVLSLLQNSWCVRFV
jgi:hypothetical protein